MKKYSGKKLAAVLLLMSLMLCAFPSLAEMVHPVGGFEAGIDPEALTSRGAQVAVFTEDELTTGHIVTFTIGIPEGKTAKTVKLLRRTDWDGKYYTFLKQDSLTFVCTFYRPGFYAFEVELTDGEISSDRFQVTGTDLLAQKAAEIVKDCPEGDDYTRALWVHDWLATHTYYDASLYNFDAGVLLYDGYGVCHSYAEAYMALLKQLNIACKPVPALNMGHIWNAICLNGEWYMTDVTWDTFGYHPAGEGTPSETCRHIYFALPSSLLSYDHYAYSDKWGCTSVADNYFMREGDGERLLGWLEEDIAAAVEAGPGTAELDVTTVVNNHDVIEKMSGWPDRYDIAAELVAAQLNETIREDRSGNEFYLTASHQASSYNRLTEEGTQHAEIVCSTAACSGSCAADVNWRFENDTLTLSGSGAVPDYPAGGAPWKAGYTDGITSVVIEDGITSVGASFRDCENLSNVTIPESVLTIAEDAFDGCTALSQAQVICGTAGLRFAKEKNLSYDASGVHRADFAGLFYGKCGVCGEAFSQFGTKVLRLPTSLAKLAASALTGTAAKKIVLPQGCLEADSGAITSCPELQCVFMPETLGESLLSENRLYDVIQPEEGQALDIVLLSD